MFVDRPSRNRCPPWQDPDGSDLWATESVRRTGHADILREGLDGRTGLGRG
ncbi:hypothetical protein [Streptomyces sp. NPDC002913]